MSYPVKNLLTNEDLRASPVPVSGTVIVADTSEAISLTIANGAALSEAFDMADKIGGAVYVPGTWTAANVGFKCSDTLDGTYDIALDKAGAPIQIGTVNTGRAGWYSIPTEIFAHKFVKLWSKSATPATETDVNQAGARAMKVLLK
jgi:hypothetical protein